MLTHDPDDPYETAYDNFGDDPRPAKSRRKPRFDDEPQPGRTGRLTEGARKRLTQVRDDALSSHPAPTAGRPGRTASRARTPGRTG